MKIQYNGNRQKVIPNIGLFKPHEPVEVTPSQAKQLLQIPGFMSASEKKVIKKSPKKKGGLKHANE